MNPYWSGERPPTATLEPVPGHITDRINHQVLGERYEGKPVSVLMSDGQWEAGAVTEQWQTRDGRWCVMLTYPIRAQATTSTGPFFRNPASFKDQDSAR